MQTFRVSGPNSDGDRLSPWNKAWPRPQSGTVHCAVDARQLLKLNQGGFFSIPLEGCTEDTDTLARARSTLLGNSVTDDDLGAHLISCALRVYSELGPGLLESVYEVCLVHRRLPRPVGRFILDYPCRGKCRSGQR